MLSSAVRIHSWYMELRMLSCGGGSMKSNSSRLSTFSDLSSSTCWEHSSGAVKLLAHATSCCREVLSFQPPEGTASRYDTSCQIRVAHVLICANSLPLNKRTVLPRLVRWISGTLVSSISLRKAASVNRRQQVPGPVRPARPLRWLAAARLSGYTCSASMPICDRLAITSASGNRSDRTGTTLTVTVTTNVQALCCRCCCGDYGKVDLLADLLAWWRTFGL